MKPELLSRAKLVRSDRYQMLAEMLCEAVQAGDLAPGAQLPTQRHLARQLGVSVSTVTRAYREVRERGYFEATVGRGTFVSLSPPGVDAAAVHAGPAIVIAAEGRSAPLDRLNRPLLHQGGLIDLSLNEPLPELSHKCLRLGFGHLASCRQMESMTAYQSPAGTARHRRAGAKWMEHLGLRVSPSEVMVVPGSQTGLTTILLALNRNGGAGDHDAPTLLCEELTWPGILSLAATLGFTVRSVAMDASGLVPEALEEMIERHSALALYVMPNLQNPTGRTMGLARRRAVVEVIHKHGLFVIEDDAYGFALRERPTALRELASERTIYVTGLSKPLSPAMRMGYMVAPERIRASMVSALRATTMMTSPILAELATRLIDSGEAFEIADAQAEVARRRQRLAAVSGIADAKDGREGMHLWMRVGPVWSTQEFVARALPLGVSVSPGTVFAAKAGCDPKGVRICLNAEPDEHRLMRGLQRLATLAAAAEELDVPYV